jgi:hypothetical protein
MTAVKITPTLTEGWLKEMGCTAKPVVPPMPDFSFQYHIDYPIGTPHRINVYGVTMQPRALVVMSQVAFSPEHIATFQDFENEEKMDFLFALNTTLNREDTEYALAPASGPLACPPAFQIQAIRYDDGLSLDTFARTIATVNKVEVAGITCVQRYLSPHGSGPVGVFDFKRSGNLQ